MAVRRMDNVLLVVEDLDAAIAFFQELGLELDGKNVVEGPWVGAVLGLDEVRADIAVVKTPDGHGRVELSKFHTPVAADAGPKAVNSPGFSRMMFAVDDIEDVLARLRSHGAELVGEVVRYQDYCLLCYVRGPGGFIVGLAEELG
ncbi:VOC family protein [Amycolatopsis sp. CA-230715]|uniref:VOC family protein n=1 Tax=Amycolatopsis sp. CA-230715 TaxID=2745196 RepID=UPI001C00C602|nr:VOC family protein [Amycolatopsis sp. CA-230715]QWF79325.1 hypothetical protein HUW46_02733 [Amycolatopsis sp. CA-230715]